MATAPSDNRLGAVEADIGDLKTHVAVLQTRLEALDTHLAEKAAEAHDDRKALHDKADKVITLVNQRIGGDRVRTAIIYAMTGGGGAAIGYAANVFTGQ